MGKLIFLKEFLTKINPFPHTYELVFRDTNFAGTLNDKEHTSNRITVIKDVPDYFKINRKSKKSDSYLLKVKSQEGYLIDLSKTPDFRSYLNSVITPKSRSNLRRYTNRLEYCFPVRYTTFYGSIDKKEYHRLFETLKTLLERRFIEKGESNYELPHLHEFEESVYSLILHKKASLKVIYDGTKPISIRINMFKGPLAYYIMSGYDIDYSKFHLGHIDMIKNIEWLYENNYVYYDLLKGYKEYKQKWYTHTYHNFYYILQKPKSFLSLVYGVLEYSRLFFLEVTLGTIRLFGLTKYGKKIFKFVMLKGGNHREKSIKLLTDYKYSSHSDEMVKINIEEQEEFKFLRRYVYEFLFKSKSPYEKTEILKHIKHPIFNIRGANEEIFIKVL